MSPKQQTFRIANKLTNFPNILQEFDYKFEKDMNIGKLMFLEDYLKTNNIKPNSCKSGYLPLLIAFNRNSQSTPCRMVQYPNRQAVCKPSKSQLVVQGVGSDTKKPDCTISDPIDSSGCKDTASNKPKLLSYDDCFNHMI